MRKTVVLHILLYSPLRSLRFYTFADIGVFFVIVIIIESYSSQLNYLRLARLLILQSV